MKNFLLGTFFLSTSIALNAQTFKFSISNQSGDALSTIQIAPADDFSWGKDLIPFDIFEDGATFEVSYDPLESGCTYDIKIEGYLDSKDIIIENINMCELDNLVLFHDDYGNLKYTIK